MAPSSRAPLGPTPVMAPVTRPSTVDLITRELRDAIYSGVLRVGSPLREIEVAGQLGVSRGPLREAAQRLVQEGLLVATPGRGLSVVRIGPDDLVDLYDARKGVETTAARIAVEKAGDAEIATVRAAYDTLVRAGESEDPRAIGDADLSFHWELVSASGNAHLRRYMSTLIVEVRIGSYSVPSDYAVRRDSPASHAPLIERLEARDADGLVAAIVENLDAAVARLLEPAESVETLEHTGPVVTRLDPLGL
ncbi:DNA-binding transcriptional regulator, GntR family [Paraoerskovia marina]|uniref:DNA-binding transcriptional regulator, GntR family n=1 Tax=Paraoerskovia marina TaxID=545619 RepID=A0A1H1QB87_9CELL|nr:GntR family transcriptional regulator [Paraoerskovia marina]SDS20781.1 DNA-binding transcriptional regulator, GntR family [Paraoerskovia marina]